ncbi:alpha/beta hydrolase [Candidatus Peregrinibacteria bacterium]|nr:alpha/beta hydrolase [Candidatus Peregrinibacteria bacterium]
MDFLKREIGFKNRHGETLRGILNSPATAMRGIPSGYGSIMLHGFKRNSTNEKKFMSLAESLSQKGVPSVQLDYLGCGKSVSEGDFTLMTVEKLRQDVEDVLCQLPKATGITKPTLVTHSLSGCVAVQSLEVSNDLNTRVLLLAPALNQQLLLRYWMIKGKRDKLKNLLEPERLLQEASQISSGEVIRHYGKFSHYARENVGRDYNPLLKGHINQVLHIHGGNDFSVPLSSVSVDFNHQIIVPDGDHDLEASSVLPLWIDAATDFLTE